MKYKLLVLAGMACVSSPAFAQDFTGFRLEGRAGWESTGAEASLPNPDDDDDVDGDELLTASDSDSAFSFGAEAGYDFQLDDTFVIGAYVGAESSTQEACSEVLGDDSACVEHSRTFTLGARAGVTMSKSALFYVKGGYSNARFKANYDPDVTDNDDDEPGEIARYSESRGGFHLGAGAEVNLGKSAYAKLEYVYADFGESRYLLDDEDDAPALGINLDRHQVLAGFGFRF